MSDAYRLYYGDGSTFDWNERESARETSRQWRENAERFTGFGHDKGNKTMDLATAIKVLWEHSSAREQIESGEAVADLLRRDGWHAAKTAGDLRELALAETDLVEPSEDE